MKAREEKRDVADAEVTYVVHEDYVEIVSIVAHADTPDPSIPTEAEAEESIIEYLGEQHEAAESAYWDMRIDRMREEGW